MKAKKDKEVLRLQRENDQLKNQVSILREELSILGVPKATFS